MAKVKQVIVSGVFWSVMNQVTVIVTSFIGLAVLSRLLRPEEFGIVAMVTVITGFLNVFRDFGLSSALIQKKDLADDEIDTIFWISMCSGFVLTACTYFSAGLIADFYKEPAVEQVAKVLSFSFFVASGGSVWANLLIKRVDFKQIFFRNLISLGISTGAAVVVAYYGFGYWALVVEIYVLLFSNLIFLYLRVKWTPSFRFKKAYVGSLFSFSFPIFGDQLTNYWMRNVDNLLVGRFLGKADLAFYSKAYSLMMLPVRQISGTISKVLFPSFSMIQDDPARIAAIYLKISRCISFVAFPLMTLLSVFAHEFILLVLGPNWLPVVPMFQVLSLLGMFQAIGTLSGNLFMARGKTMLLFRMGLFSRSCMIAGIVLGLYFGGLMGMIYGYCIASFFAFGPELYFAGSVIHLSLKRIVTNFLPYLGATIVAGMFVHFTRSFYFPGTVFQLFVGGIVGAAVYLIIVVAFQLKAFRELIELVTEVTKRRK